jgi:hypothetical protein
MERNLDFSNLKNMFIVNGRIMMEFVMKELHRNQSAYEDMGVLSRCAIIRKGELRLYQDFIFTSLHSKLFMAPVQLDSTWSRVNVNRG